MRKKIVFLFAFVFLFAGSLLSQAQQDTFTITTYFPAPYGMFQNLTAKRVAVGLNTPMPSSDGELSWGADGNARGLLRQDGSMELGTNAATGRPYIIFGISTTSTRNITLTDANHLTFYIPSSRLIINSSTTNGAELWVGRVFYVDGWGVTRVVDTSHLTVNS